MPKENGQPLPFIPPNTGAACCTVEAVVSVDERGQMVLPKDIRNRLGIGAGDKLALVGWEQEGKLCCISFIKVEELNEIVKTRLEPVVQGVFQ